MFWQIGGAVDTTAPVRASAGSAPGRARLLTWGYVQYEIRPDGVAHPTAEQDRSRRDRSATEEGIALVTAALPDRRAMRAAAYRSPGSAWAPGGRLDDQVAEHIGGSACLL